MRPVPPRSRPRLRRLSGLLLGAALAFCAISTRADDARAGDAPDHPGPRAQLDGSLRPDAVRAAAARVAAWQLARVADHPSLDWTFAPLYLGFLRISDLLHDPRYAGQVEQVARHVHWQLGPRARHADDQAIAQAYLVLHQRRPEPGQLAPMRQRFDAQMKVPDDPDHPVWWWCDALFMAPPGWARLAAVSHDRAYLDYMDRQWWITSAALYDGTDHLFSRDASYLSRRERNGHKLYWSRGNGWVIAGLARVLDTLPRDYPHRDRYLRQFRAMAAALAALQGKDGLWRPGLMDANAYPQPEVSGSAFITYALGWGIRHGVLDDGRYRPVVASAWRGLVGQIYADGRLGNIQPIGAAPDHYPASASYVYGVGAFLLAAVEVAALDQAPAR